MREILRVDKLNTFYGDFNAVKDVSLIVNHGELVLLFGPNGHGKSTLLKTISRLIPARSGTIRFKGEDITNTPSHKIVEMGLVYISEERNLFREMTVFENLKLGAYNHRARAKADESYDYVFDLFPKLRLWSGRMASTLSGGEARMLAIGRGLMSQPEFLAIDEPSFGLAPNLRSDVFRTIGQIKGRDISIILVEQSVTEVADLADRVYLLEDGRIAFEGTKEQVHNNPHVRKAFLGK